LAVFAYLADVFVLGSIERAYIEARRVFGNVRKVLPEKLAQARVSDLDADDAAARDRFSASLSRVIRFATITAFKFKRRHK
jgi:hypothetical protein